MPIQIPTFTAEELIYIEKQFDLNASLFEGRIRKSIETFMLSQASNEGIVFTQALADGVMELVEANKITNSIRKKIEEWRKSAIKQDAP